eukprot:gene13229-14587_t
MVRNYKKKIIRKFDKKQLEEAVGQFVNGEKSLRQLEREYGIPRNTISRWAKEEQPHRFGADRTTKLSHETESVLVDAIKYLGELGWPMDLQQIRSIIESYLIKTKQISLFPNNTPGEDWVQGFRKRWSSELSLREPEYVTAARVKDKNIGYVQNVSPIKKSKRKNYYYQFEFQVSPTEFTKVVGFDIKCQPQVTKLEESKTAAVLKGLKKSTDDTLLFNQSSSAQTAAAFDVDFNYVQKEQPNQNKNDDLCKTITLSNIEVLKPLQRVNVVATLTMGNQSSKSVVSNATQMNTQVKEDCVPEDLTGSIPFHVWGAFIEQLKSGQTYKFEDLMLRQYQSSMYLSTTTNTKFSEEIQQVESISGPTLLSSPFTEITVKEIKFVKRLAIYTACQYCRKKITENHIDAKTIKCQHCAVRQRSANCKTNASVQLTMVTDNDEDTVALTAFNEVIE